MSTSATRPTRARQARNFTLALPDAVVTSFASTSAYIHSDDEHDHPKLHKKKSLKKVPVKSKLAQEKDTAAIDHAEESPPRKVAKNANGKKVSKNKEELQVEATMYEEVPVGVDEMVPSKVKKVKKARKIQVVEEAAVKQEKGKGKRRRVDDAEDELRVESVHLHVEQSVIDGAWRPLATLTKDAIISELASLIPSVCSLDLSLAVLTLITVRLSGKPSQNTTLNRCSSSLSTRSVNPTS